MKKLKRFVLLNADVAQSDIINKNQQKHIIGGYIPMENCKPPVIHPDCRFWKCCSIRDEFGEYITSICEYDPYEGCGVMQLQCDQMYKAWGWSCCCCCFYA